MGREAWGAAVHGVAMSQTWLSDQTELNWMKLRRKGLVEWKNIWIWGWVWFSLSFLIYVILEKSCYVLLLLLSCLSRVRLCATHRRQPTKLPCPWESPGKNTGVGCHCLLQCMKVKSESEVAQSCPTLSDPIYCSLPGSSVHGIFQTRVLKWLPLPCTWSHNRWMRLGDLSGPF